MCARYVLINGKMVLQSFLSMHIGSMKDVFSDLPRYNAAPMQLMPVVAMRDNEIVIQKMKWWLVPGWSKEGKIKVTTFNARAETLDQSRIFSPYFKSSRCLIPAEAFYEWKRIESKVMLKRGERHIIAKQPMCIRMKDEKPFMFAGLFSIWKNEKGEEFPGFTIITTGPNRLMSEIHNRMPVILPEKYLEQWLDKKYNETDKLKKLLVSYPALKMKACRVTDYLNNPRHESPGCMIELEE